MALIKFDVTNRWSGAVQFTAEIECDDGAPTSVKLGLAVRWAVKAGADLVRANLAGCNLAGSNLAGANLAWADLAGSNLVGSNLAGVDLAGADLVGAKGIAPERCTPLLMLLDQPGKIRAYKLVTTDLKSPVQSSGRLTYDIGKTIKVKRANTDPNDHCAAGVNVATLDWCLKNWSEGLRVLIVEFEAKDIACIPTASDGKFRLHRCTVVAEKPLDLEALGLVKKEKIAA